MLKELLPSKNLQPENPPNLRSSLLRSDANLLERHEFFKKDIEIKRKFLRMYNSLIFLLCLITLILLGINSYYNNKLDTLKNQLSPLILEMESNAPAIRKVRILEDQINKYKNILTTRKKMTVPVERIVTTTNEDMELLSFRGSQTDFEISARSKNPAGIVQVIYKLLNSGVINKIILSSAEVNTATGIYTIELKGVYK